MKSSLLFLTFLVHGFLLYSQSNNKKISGQVRDIRNEPVSSATVRLMTAADSSVLETKVTKDNGRFVFERLAPGSYHVQVTATGSKLFTSAALTTDEMQSEIVIPAVILMPSKVTELKEVTVTAKRPLIEQELDKTIVNADAMIGSATGSTLEILEKTPGVSIDQSGNITLNGNSGVMVLVDGRTVYMSGSDLAAYLRSLPGSMVDKLELMTNPPAKYDAGGNAIINIRLKRNRLKGYTGNISTNANMGQRTFRSYNYAGVNYMERKVNIFMNVSYSKDANTTDDNSTRGFYNTGGNKMAELEIESKYRYRSRELACRAGIDYNFSPKTVAGLVFNYGYRPRNEESRYTNNNDVFANADDVNGYGNMNGFSRWKNAGANANLTHRFNEKGKELTVDLNYIRYINNGDQDFINSQQSFSGDSSYQFLYDLYSSIRIYNARADYVHPLGSLQLSAGAKVSWVVNDISSDYFDVLPGAASIDFSKSNHFAYDENIAAGYINSRKNWKRISLQFGLRLENTSTKGNQLGNVIVPASIVYNNYTNLFPSAFASYKLDSLGKHTLTASFSRRLNRPNYQSLNPFLVFRDQYSYSAGNPDLGPVYGIRYELSYRFSQWLGVTVMLDRLADQIVDVTEVEGDVFITRPSNGASGQMKGLTLNSNFSPVKNWTVNINARTANFYNRTVLDDSIVKMQQQAYRVDIFNQFSFKNDWSAEIFGGWTSRIIQWQRVVDPRWRVIVGVQKKLLKKKASIKLNIEDVFYTWRTSSKTIGLKDISFTSINVQDTRRIAIGFNWSFGKETFARKRKNNDNAADDLKGRVE